MLLVGVSTLLVATLHLAVGGEKLILFIDLRVSVGTLNERRYQPVVIGDSGMEFAIVCAVAIGAINRIDCSRAMQSVIQLAILAFPLFIALSKVMSFAHPN